MGYPIFLSRACYADQRNHGARTMTGGGVNARWGDYSTTVLDPGHPFTFWTFQEWVSAESVWSTQITELKLGKSGAEHDDSEATDHGENADSGSSNESDEAESRGCSEDTAQSLHSART